MDARNTLRELILLWAGFFPFFVPALCAQLVTVPVTLALDPPAATAPGVNNLKIDLDAGFVADSDTSQLTGSIGALAVLNVADPDNPVLIGIEFQSGNISFSDTSFVFFVPFVVNVSITGTGVGGTVFTPSGKPEPVIANTFDAALHNLELNQGILLATGTAGFPPAPINDSQDLSTDPLSGPGTGTGSASAVKTGNTPLDYTYEIAMSLPTLLQSTIPVSGGTINVDVTVAGTIAATGSAVVTILPNLKPVQKTPAGFDLEITGNAGANVILCATQDMVTFTDIANLTLPLTANTYTDAGADPLDGRYYLLRKP